jgi:hypothetical protein
MTEAPRKLPRLLPGFTSILEGLPHENERVLVDAGNLCVCGFVDGQGRWHAEGDEGVLRHIVGWKPLPPQVNPVSKSQSCV